VGWRGGKLDSRRGVAPVAAARVSLGAVAARGAARSGGCAGQSLAAGSTRRRSSGWRRRRWAACQPIDDKRGYDGVPHRGRGRAGAPGGPDRAGPGEDQLMAKHHIEARVNGDAVEFLCETEETLLDVLRDTMHLTGSKEGCSSGDCGACSVMLGRAARLLLPGAGVRGERTDHRDHRGPGHRRASPPAAAGVPHARGAPVRDLHARLPGGGEGPARPEHRPERKPRCATGWPAISAGARATTRS